MERPGETKHPEEDLCMIDIWHQLVDRSGDGKDVRCGSVTRRYGADSLPTSSSMSEQ